MVKAPTDVRATAICVHRNLETTETAGLDLHQRELNLDIAAL